MKLHTIHVLDKATDFLDQFGFKKKKRGLALRESSDPDLTEAISFQPQEWADGTLLVNVFVHVIWDDLEDVSSQGWSIPYKFGASYSASEMMTELGRSFEFRTEIDDRAEFENLEQLVKFVAIPRIEALASKEAVHQHISNEVVNGAGYPEKLIAIEWLTRGKAKAAEKFESLVASEKDSFIAGRISEFWQRLSQSTPT